MPYFNPGGWQPAPFNPGSGNEYFNPLPPMTVPENPNLPNINLPQPTPGVEPRPYTPPDAGGVIGDRPGFASGAYYGAGPVVSTGNQFQPNLARTGANVAGGLLAGPIGSWAAGLIFDRLLGGSGDVLPPSSIRSPSLVPTGTGAEVPYFLRNPEYDDPEGRDGYMDEAREGALNFNNFLSRRRDGSSRFSQGEMDLSNLPMYGAPGSLLPAVFAGERGSAMPGGGQAPRVEQR